MRQLLNRASEEISVDMDPTKVSVTLPILLHGASLVHFQNQTARAARDTDPQLPGRVAVRTILVGHFQGDTALGQPGDFKYKIYL